MNQFDFEREFDAEASAEFSAAGLASSRATYTPPGGASVNCTVLVDHDAQSEGELTPITEATAIVTLFKAEIATPLAKGVVTLIDGDGVPIAGASFTLVAFSRGDFSRSIWICRHG